MKLYFYEHANFGDALNPFLWTRLLPGVFDEDRSTLFVGTGTLLNNGLPPKAKKLVFGSGAGYGSALPTVDERWDVFWVRGPRTAQALGLDARAFISDGALLLRTLDLPPAAQTNETVFMPHWRSTAFWDWQSVCTEVGLTYLDPCAPVPELLARLRSARLVITEALHGAIVADAFRVPWVAVRAYRSVLQSKWEDWCASLGLAYQPVALPSLYSAASMVEKFGERGKALAVPMQAVNPFLVARAKRVLVQIQKNPLVHLSTDANLERATARMLEQLARFRRDYGAA